MCFSAYFNQRGKLVKSQRGSVTIALALVIWGDDMK